MSPDLSILEGAYLRDLLDQPRAVADTVAGLRGLARLPPRALASRRIVLTGMGSSLHAQHPLLIRLVQAGRTALMVETAELVHSQAGLLDADTLVVAVSQSGLSAEIVQLMDRVAASAAKPFIIGVTNTADSPLARRADFVVATRAGAEFSVSCKTYLATLLALEWLGSALCSEDPDSFFPLLEQAEGAVQNTFQTWRGQVTQLCGDFAGMKHLFLAGRGTSLAAVNTGALILKESTRFHAEGMSVPAFRHGPLEMVGPGFYALVFAGDSDTAPLNVKLVRDIGAAGGRAFLVGEMAAPGPLRLPMLPARLRPVMEILPVQLLSLALSALACREPGRFERATKVTIVA